MKKRWNGFAVAGFVMSFTNCLLGLVFSVIGVGSADKYNEKGKGLAIAGIVISVINIIVVTIAVCIFSVLIATFIATVPNLLTNEVVDRAQEAVIETYAKDHYENDIHAREGSKSLKKMADKGFTFTVEDMDKNTPGIKDIYRSCDIQKSKVIIYPVEPYGKKDYIIKTHLECNN